MVVFLWGLAFLFMIARAVVWQNVLKTESLSSVYPYSALVQVLIVFYAVVFFQEEIKWHHSLGVLLMLIGIFVIAKGQKKLDFT